MFALDELDVHPHAANQGMPPLDAALMAERFARLLDECSDGSRKPIKAFLVRKGNVCGIGNGDLQDALFRLRLSPKRRVPDLTAEERTRRHATLVETIHAAVVAGGRDTEHDLFHRPGGYVPLLDRRAKDRPCPACGTTIARIAYLGGSRYVCLRCPPSP